MNVREIVVEHLKAGGFDGLAAEDCGCSIDDIMPCCSGDRDISECRPARKVVCKDTGFAHCASCDYGCNDVERETACLYVAVESDA